MDRVNTFSTNVFVISYSNLQQIFFKQKVKLLHFYAFGLIIIFNGHSIFPLQHKPSSYSISHPSIVLAHCLAL